MVWELSLGLLPATTRLLLLSATVGNASSFLGWLRSSHKRRLKLVTSDQRRVPLEYHWIGEELLGDDFLNTACRDSTNNSTNKKTCNKDADKKYRQWPDG